MSPKTQQVLRCVPDADSGESVTPLEVAGRLAMRPVCVQALLSRAARNGLVVRIRQGSYQLAKGVR
jgi:hypothetical protein